MEQDIGGHWRKYSREPSHVENSLYSATSLPSILLRVEQLNPEEGRSVKTLLKKLQEEEAINQVINNNQTSNQNNQIPNQTNPTADGAYLAPHFHQYLAPRNFHHQPPNLSAHYTSYSRSHPYQNPRGGFQTQRGGFQAQRGGFQAPRGGFSTQRGNSQGFRGCFRGGFRGFRGSNQPHGELCSYCGLGPHKVTNCKHKKRDEGNQEANQSNANFSHLDQQQEAPEPDQYAYGYTSSETIDFETFGFVADSGSSEHMTDKRSILINFKPIQKGTHCVRGIGNSSLEAEGKGDIEVINSAGQTLLFRDVLFVPGLGVNLFSISAATAKGAEAIFFDNMVIFFTQNKTTDTALSLLIRLTSTKTVNLR